MPFPPVIVLCHIIGWFFLIDVTRQALYFCNRFAQVSVCKCNATMCYYLKHTVNGQWSCIYIASFKSDSSKCLSYSSIQTHGLLCLRGNFMFSICTWNADCRGWGPSDQRTTSLRSEWATVTLTWLTRHSMWGRVFSFSVALCIPLWNIWLTKCNHYQNASQLHLVKTAFSYFFHFGCVLILLKKNIWLSLTNLSQATITLSIDSVVGSTLTSN